MTLNNKNRFITAIVLLILIAGNALAAQIYQWRDEKGQLHFGDKPPVASAAQEVKLKINSFESVEIIYNADSNNTQNNKTDKQPRRQKKDNNIVMYSAKGCIACSKAKSYLTKHKIPFTEYDVQTSDKGKQDFKQMNSPGVPIIQIGEARMLGFSAARFKMFYDSVMKQP